MFRLCDIFNQFSPLGICEPVDSEHCMNQNYWLDCNSMLPFECEAFEDPGMILWLYDYMWLYMWKWFYMFDIEYCCDSDFMEIGVFM